MKPLLSVKNLSISAQRNRETEPVLKSVSFDLQPNSVLAIIGESGSGKSSLCRALTRLLPAGMNFQGTALLQSTDLLSCSDDELRAIRRSKVRYVFQEPSLALNPLQRIKTHMKHASPDAEISISRMIDALRQARLADGSEILHSYPHQLSIGMQQRVMIAMAVIAEPLLLIADEPTSALDESMRDEIMDLLFAFVTNSGMALLLVTHDLAIAKKYADDVGVLYQGELIEMAEATKFFREPTHPYSTLLVDSFVRSEARPHPANGSIR